MISTFKGKSKLFLASSLCDGLEDNDIKQVITLLKHKGSDPNVLLPNYGISPFHLVIGHESEKFSVEVTKLFLRYEGNPNVKADDGMTPVHVAAAWGRVKVLELLLANGGDPLCLDNDGRSPFHYAFDGKYYAAIALLGKYCNKNDDSDDENHMSSDDDVDEKPKVQIKLEKILVNRGNIIAEYVPSDVECVDDNLVNELEYNSTSNNNIQIVERNLNEVKNNDDTNEFNVSSSSSVSVEEAVANITDSNLNINYDNVTFRRTRTKNRYVISPIFPPTEEFNVYQEYNNNNKHLVDKVIHQLPNSFSEANKSQNLLLKDCIINDDDNKIVNKYSNLFVQSKTCKNSTMCTDKTIPRTPTNILDNSLVSKSPNCKINISITDKLTITPTSLIFKKSQNKNSYKHKNNDLKNFNIVPSSKPLSSLVQTKSTNFKSSEHINRIHYQYTDKRFQNEVNSEKTGYSTNHTCFESGGNIKQSLQTDLHCNNINKKNLLDNIITKYNNSTDDDDCSSKSIVNINNNNSNEKEYIKTGGRKVIPEKTNKFWSEIDTHSIPYLKKVKFCNNCPEKLGACTIIKQLHDDKNIEKKCKNEVSPEKNDNFKYIIESPGSSQLKPTNVSYKNDLNEEEEFQLYNEVNEIYQSKELSPPMSVSIIDDQHLTSIKSPNSVGSNNGNSVECKKMQLLIKKNLDDFYNDEQENCSSNMLAFEDSNSINSQIFRTPMRSMMSSNGNNDSFVSIDEEYAYLDIDKNVAFLERRLLVMPNTEDMDKVKNESTWLDRLANLSVNSYQTFSSKQSNILDKNTIGNNTLRDKLISLGEIPGPITGTTYNVYLKRLRKLEHQVNLNNCLITTNACIEVSRISKISRNVLNVEWLKDIEYYQNLEDQVFREYGKPSSAKKYRGGIGTSSFNYLLLDPRVTKDLPRVGRNLSQVDRWKIFLEAIFYIGKGKAARPAAHLYEAFDIWTGKKQIDEPSEKIQRIIDIWREDRGVVCLHVFMNTMQEEAFSREAAMIDALSTRHLSNCNRGNYYGILSTMSKNEKQSLGKYLLYKAMEIFMYEGERQIFPKSIL